VARPHEAHERPAVGLSLATPTTAQAPTEVGKPVLGGYRIAAGEKPTAAEVSAAAPVLPAPAPAPRPEPVQSPAPEPEPVQPPAPQAEPAARFGLRFDTGESISISEPVLLGRNPDATEHPGASAIALADESRSLSKTHMLVRPVDGGLEIVDCSSTNGSGFIRGGTEYGVAARTPTVVTDGDMIRLGDRVAAVVHV
jgi:hypothetical protein